MIDQKRQLAESDGRSTLRAYLQLVRLPNIFTSIADVVMGFLFVRGITGVLDAGILGLLIVASASLYAAGVVLNDVFDFHRDTAERPERPLPSGRVRRGVAAFVGWELMLVGVAAAWGAASLAGGFAPGLVALALAACIAGYDAWLKRTPVGPLAMGACRMLNVLLGMSVAVQAWQVQHALVAGGIAIYIVGVTWFARTEARESNSVYLGLATLVMLAGIGMLWWFPDFRTAVQTEAGSLEGFRILMIVLGVLIGWRCLHTAKLPTPQQVQMTVRRCILSVVMLDAAVCYYIQGPKWGVAVLALALPTMLAGAWIEST